MGHLFLVAPDACILKHRGQPLEEAVEVSADKKTVFGRVYAAPSDRVRRPRWSARICKSALL
jgi:hypothetical protein